MVQVTPTDRASPPCDSDALAADSGTGCGLFQGRARWCVIESDPLSIGALAARGQVPWVLRGCGRLPSRGSRHPATVTNARRELVVHHAQRSEVGRVAGILRLVIELVRVCYEAEQLL